jgi:hypothetical protein
MRHGWISAVACLLFISGLLPAQERIPLPPPDPTPAGAAPALLPSPSPAPAQAGPPGAPPTNPPPPPPGGPQLTSPAPPLYPPPYPPPPPGFYAGPPPYPAPGPFRSSTASDCSADSAITGPLRRSGVVFRDPVGDPGIWIGLEGLLWWSKGQPLSVPLITTGPASQGANAGNLGAPGTVSLNDKLDYGVQGGFRFSMGGWFDCAHTIGLEGSIFFLDEQNNGFGVGDRSGNGSFVINEPVSGAPFVTQVSAPGVATGNVLVNSFTRFGGGDLDLMYNLYRGRGWTINLLGGYRFLELDEELDVSGNSNLLAGTTFTDGQGNVLANAPAGSYINTLDQFRTRNEFNGGQIGANVQYQWGRWSLNGTAKLAIGATHEVVTVNGSSYILPPNAAPTTLTGGNFATLQIGRYSNDRFALAPEATLALGYQITPHIRATIGYNFLFLSSVVRPGNQIDNTFDGITHPTVPMSSSSFWAQGLNLGLQFRF